MAAFHFELVSPEKLMFSGEVESVVLSSTEGEMTVLKDHAPLMAAMRPCVIVVEETAGKKSQIFVQGGFAEISPKGLTVLAEEALPLEQLDAARLDAQATALEEELKAAQSDEAARAASEKLSQLRELRTAIKI